jgi:hypothetical protein
MHSRVHQLAKIACLTLAALVLLQLARAIIRSNPLANVAVPAIPSWSTNTAAVKETDSPAVQQLAGVTNAPRPEPAKSTTNLVSQLESEKTTTNTFASAKSLNPETPVSVSETNRPSSTNPPSVLNSATLSIPGPGSNRIAEARPSPAHAMAMAGMPGAGKKLPDLAPAIKARVDRITDSEMLGPVIRPMPMALLGIAGNVALLRSPGGQTGLVKEGDSLGELKLLRIGVNRVLVEEAGQKKELTIFSGYGSESLLVKQGETPDETTRK